MTPLPDPPRRRLHPMPEPDGEDQDFREMRRPISGTEPELRLGVGNWALTLKGRENALLLIGFGLLGLVGWHVVDMAKSAAETQAVITKTSAETQAATVSALDKISARHERIFRLGLCIARLTPVEVKDWRERTVRDPQAALWVYCPELMVPSP